LVVLDLMHDPDCDMFKNANLECYCSIGFRAGQQSELTSDQIAQLMEINIA